MGFLFLSVHGITLITCLLTLLISVSRTCFLPLKYNSFLVWQVHCLIQFDVLSTSVGTDLFWQCASGFRLIAEIRSAHNRKVLRLIISIQSTLFAVRIQGVATYRVFLIKCLQCQVIWTQCFVLVDAACLLATCIQREHYCVNWLTSLHASDHTEQELSFSWAPMTFWCPGIKVIRLEKARSFLHLTTNCCALSLVWYCAVEWCA